MDPDKEGQNVGTDLDSNRLLLCRILLLVFVHQRDKSFAASEEAQEMIAQ